MSTDPTITTTVLAISVHPVGSCPAISEEAIHIALVDEGGGVFFEVSNVGNAEHPLRASLDELKALADAAARLLNQSGVKA